MGKGIPVKLQVFEGPLDLLLHLIDKNKIDIYDIPIVEITNQYMEYIQEVTLPEKLEYVYEYAKVHHRFSFRDLLKKQASKVQIIVTFLAVLELMKTGEIQVYQEHTFDDIIITSDEGLRQGV